MTLKLYADECVDGRVVAGLRRRGADVVTAGERSLLGSSDDLGSQASWYSRPEVFITWRDWMSYRVQFQVAAANSPTPKAASAKLDVLAKFRPISFWNLTSSTVVAVASLVLPVARGLGFVSA